MFATIGISIVIMFYMLVSKKELQRQGRKLMYAYLKKEIAEKIDSANIFDNIVSFSVDEIRREIIAKSKIKKHFGKMFNYIYYKKFAEKVLLPEKKYGVTFYSVTYSFMELLLYLKEMHNSKMFLMDDGVMSYRNVSHCLAESGKAKYIKHFLEIKTGKINPEKLFYLPELYQELNPQDKILPHRLNTVSDKNVELARAIFNVSDSDKIACKVVIIECNVGEYLYPEEADKLEAIYESIIKKYGSENVFFKRHPRDKREEIEGRTYMRGSVPFEAYNCIQDMSNIILVAWDSTAVLTSKIFFGQEPRIALLYKLVSTFNKDANLEATDKFYQAFRNCYNDPNRMLILENSDEWFEEN